MQKPALKQPILFISDAHLGGFSSQENNRIESELIELIDYCQKNNIHIAILGDLFDYWMEYPNHIPKIGQHVLDRFKDYNRYFGPTLYVTGNHDHWTRNLLTDAGFYVTHEQFQGSINGKKLTALHGEGLTDQRFNLPLPLLHRFIRHELFIAIFQSIFPAKYGLAIMKYFSLFSRFLDRHTEDPDTLNHWAQEQLRKKESDIIVCGHDHLPRQKQFPFGTYVNLGTFYKHRTLAMYNNDTISLVLWEKERQSIKLFETQG